MVGILSFWDGLFSGAMLVSGSVYSCVSWSFFLLTSAIENPMPFKPHQLRRPGHAAHTLAHTQGTVDEVWGSWETHPRSRKWLGSPPFIGHEARPFGRLAFSTLLRGRKRSPWLILPLAHSGWSSKSGVPPIHQGIKIHHPNSPTPPMITSLIISKVHKNTLALGTLGFQGHASDLPSHPDSRIPGAHKHDLVILPGDEDWLLKPGCW